MDTGRTNIEVARQLKRVLYLPAVICGITENRSSVLTAEQEWTVITMDKTCSNCKHAIGFGPQHDKVLYTFCAKRSDVAKIKFLAVSRKDKCNAWEKRSDNNA